MCFRGYRLKGATKYMYDVETMENTSKKEVGVQMGVSNGMDRADESSPFP